MKKVHTRTVTADNGYALRTVAVVSDGQIVDDDRNGTTILAPDGDQIAVIPLSPQALDNTRDWLDRIQSAA
jgi:hypothetical protein